MGEFLILNAKDKLKIGTIDDLRYVRYTELVAMSKTLEGMNSPDVASGLKDPNSLYRFPFPWEDGQNWDAIGRRNMFEPTITLFSSGIEVEHTKVVQCIAAPGGGYQVNLYLPCPYQLTKTGKQDNPLEVSLCSALPPPTINIVGERVYEDHHRTIFGCIYCQKFVSFNEPEIELLRLLNKRSVDVKILDRLSPNKA